MIYERYVLQKRSVTTFMYALHRDDANHIEVGLGSESYDGLQVTHLKTALIHRLHVREWAYNVSLAGIGLHTGKLAYLLATGDKYFPDSYTACGLANMALSVGVKTWPDLMAAEGV